MEPATGGFPQRAEHTQAPVGAAADDFWADSALLSQYMLTSTTLGSGGTATVRLARRREEATGAEDMYLAVKVLEHKAKSSLESLRREVKILQELQGHPSVVRCHGACHVHFPKDLAAAGYVELAGLFCQPHGCASCAQADEPVPGLLLQCCAGGDLCTRAARGACSEQLASQWMRGILSGLVHVHARDIVHRDVKVENILLNSQGRAILVDFGTAAHLSDAQEMLRQCGTPGYCAPEVIRGQPYNTKIDPFGAGVVLYFILSGRRPFRGGNVTEVLKRTLKCRVKFQHSEEFDRVSESCKALITALLERDPALRVSASTALDQPWFLDTPELHEELLNSVSSKDSEIDFASKFNLSWLEVSPYVDLNDGVEPSWQSRLSASTSGSTCTSGYQTPQRGSFSDAGQLGTRWPYGEKVPEVLTSGFAPEDRRVCSDDASYARYDGAIDDGVMHESGLCSESRWANDGFMGTPMSPAPATVKSTKLSLRNHGGGYRACQAEPPGFQPYPNQLVATPTAVEHDALGPGFYDQPGFLQPRTAVDAEPSRPAQGLRSLRGKAGISLRGARTSSEGSAGDGISALPTDATSWASLSPVTPLSHKTLWGSAARPDEAHFFEHPPEGSGAQRWAV